MWKIREKEINFRLKVKHRCNGADVDETCHRSVELSCTSHAQNII